MFTATAGRPCGVPGCVATAAQGAFCPPHQWAVDHPASDGPQVAPRPQADLDAIIATHRRSHPHLLGYLRGAERLPLPFPALLDSQFYSPTATLLLSDTLSPALEAEVIDHELMHLAQHVRRHRRRAHPGVAAERGTRARGRFVAWDHVDARQVTDLPRLELPLLSRAVLAAAAPACPGCATPAADLAWTYFTSPIETWLTFQGTAGWLAVCDACRDQAAFFIDRQN
jgi:hypothetical protein